MTAVIWVLIIIFLLYAFVWIFSFLPFVFGFLYGVVYFPVEIINQVVYPVWPVVYLFYTWLLFYVLVKSIFNLYRILH